MAKEHWFIPECEIYIGDGISGSFADVDYWLAGTCAAVTNAPKQIDCYGIGTFVKVRFNRKPEKTNMNPCG